MIPLTPEESAALPWGLLLLGLVLLAMLVSLWRYVFPPRCETCGRRYNHKYHAECPFCHPLPVSGNHLFVILVGMLVLGLVAVLIQDRTSLLLVVATGLCWLVIEICGISIHEVSWRVALIFLLCLGVAAGYLRGMW